jgi:hypothetical protein
MNWYWLSGLITSDRIIAFATVGYLVVTLVMFFEIRSQATAANRQANIMERQIALQEAALEQWITVANWKIDVVNPGEWKEAILDINFSIVNQTNFPLTLNEISFSGEGQDHTFTEALSLAPRGDPYTVNVAILISEEMAKNAVGIEIGPDFYTALNLTVKIVVRYTDILKARRSETFIGDLTCHRGKAAEFTRSSERSPASRT